MKNITNKILTIVALAFAPLSVFAQNRSASLCGPIKYSQSLQSYLCEAYRLVGYYLIPLLTLAALGWFMWNAIMLIKNANVEKLRGEYKIAMMWGLVALFVMVSVWGIVGIMGGIVGTNTSVIPQIRYK
ncbi:MAG: hypothetical protein KBB86_00135 [Candidatus Pacebacteria bacterium]|nr:hypothetical protein [Candidatus Paceibacterota bacterium]